MADMYERIDKLLAEKGITGAKMSTDLGMSRSFMTELRKGRAKSVKIETAQKIANYLGVSVEYITTGIPANVCLCPDDENPWEVELLDAFDRLDIDRQIEAVEHVQNMAVFGEVVAKSKKTPALTEKGEHCGLVKNLNVLRIAGRDGSYEERLLTDEQLAAVKAIIHQLPDASNDL